MKNDNHTYKQTHIGLIPSDWEVKKLGEIAKIKHGKDQKGIEEKNGKYPILGTGGEMGRTNSFLCDKPSVLIGRKGTIDKPRFMDTPFWTVDTLFYTELSNQIVPKWLYNVFQTINWYFYNEASGVPSLSGSTISAIDIAVPPHPEQQKIAAILSTWDAAIDNCKATIENLKIRNKGLAQQLLTGKTRVKGFEKTKWKFVAINKIAKEVSLKNPSDKDLIVMSCTKYDGLVPSLEYFGRKIYSDDLTTYKIVKKGQFAYATNHIEEGSIGYQSKYDEALISPMYTVFQTDDSINDDLLFRILKSHQYIHEYQKRMEGSIDRRGGLRWDEFSKIKVPVIALDEQKAINNILVTASGELSQYQQKLEKLQLQKKGLMQQLLTGKIRVNIN